MPHSASGWPPAAPRFKVPAAFEFVPQLPHSPTGKVHKLTLKKLHGLA